MNSYKELRILAMVIVGLFTAVMIYGSTRQTSGLPGLVLIPFAILITGAVTMFLAWKRPLAGGLVVLFLALVYFLFGAYQSIDIFGANAGAFIFINLIIAIPLLLAGLLLLVAHRKIK